MKNYVSNKVMGFFPNGIKNFCLNELKFELQEIGA